MLPAIVLFSQIFASTPIAVTPSVLQWKEPVSRSGDWEDLSKFQETVHRSLGKAKNSPALLDTVAKWVVAAGTTRKLEVVLSEAFLSMEGSECDSLRDWAWNRAMAGMAGGQTLQERRDVFQHSEWGRRQPRLDLARSSIRPGKPVEFRTFSWGSDRVAQMDSLPIELAKLVDFASASVRAEVIDTVWARPLARNRGSWSLDSLPSEGLWRLSIALEDVFSEKFCLATSLDGAVVRDGTRLALWGSSLKSQLAAPYQVLIRLPDGSWHEDSTGEDGLKEYRIDPGTANRPLEIFLRKEGHLAVLQSPVLYGDLGSGRARASLWTDRPIYRPGDTVHVMGLLLERDKDGDLTQLHPDSVEVELGSLVGAPSRRAWLRIDRAGQFSGSFRLAPDERQGQMEISVAATMPRSRYMESAHHSFEVQAYRRPEFEVRLTTSEPSVLRGDSVRLVVEASYLHGAPLNNARVRLNIGKVRGLFDGFRAGQESLRDTTLLLGSDGKAYLAIATAYLGSWESIRVQALVEDVSRRSESATIDIPVWPTALRIDAHFLSSSSRVGSPLRVVAKVTDRNRKPVVGSFHLRHVLDLEVVQDTTVKTDSTGVCTLTVVSRKGGKQYLSLAASKTGTVPWSIQILEFPPESTNGSEAEFDVDRSIASAGDTLRLSARGLPGSGRLWFVSEGRRLDTHFVGRTDSLGRWSASWRIGPSMRPKGKVKIFFDAEEGMKELSRELTVREPHRILRADIQVKPVLRPADTLVANIRIRDIGGNGVKGRFSFSIVDDALWKLAAPASPYRRWERSIPLSEIDLSLDWFGSETRVSGWWERHPVQQMVRTMDVRWPATFGKLPRRCIPPKRKPEREENYGLGRMRARISPPRPGSDGDRMAGVGGIGLGSASRERSMAKSTLQRREAEAEPSQSPSGVEVADYPEPSEFTPPSRIRTDFRELAFWSDSVSTDSAGEAVVKVVLPDDLTRWRLVLRGADGNGRVVDAQQFVRTRRDLMVKLQTPRFLVEGDTSRIATEVHNLSTQSRNVVVAVDAKDSLARFLGTMSIHKSMAGGSTVSPEWTLVADTAGSTRLGAQAKASDDADGLERSIPVSVHGVPRVQVRSGRLRTPLDSARLVGHVFDRDLFSKTALARGRSVRLDVSASLAPGLLGPLGYLTGYPYGCVEQTLSRFVPNLAVASALRRSGMRMDTLEANLPLWTDAGLERLSQLQNADGGWGWWTEKSSDPRLTVLVMEGLSLALEEAGKHREDAWGARVRRIRQMMRNGRGSLQVNVESPSVSRSLRVRGLRVLATIADRPDEAWIAKMADRLWSARKGVDASTDADFLEIAHALKRALMESEAAQAIWSRSISESVVDGRMEPGVHWTGSHAWDGQGDSIEVTASVLRSLVRTSQANGQTAKIVAWLSAQRRGEGWGSTRATAKVVEALALALESMDESRTRGEVRILAGKRKIASFVVGAGNLSDAKASVSFRDSIPSSLQVTFSGTGHVYWTLDTRWTEGGAYLKSCSTSLAVRRTYRKVVPVRLAGGGTSESTVPFDGHLKSGELLEVRVELDSKSPVGHLMLEDPFPAGTEVVRESMGEKRPRWWGFQATHQEARDDRMVWFLAEKPAGTASFAYRLRAERPGTYHALPARAELMYRPEVQANSDETIVRIEGK